MGRRKGCMLAHQHNRTLVPKGKGEGKRSAETPGFPELHKDLALMRKGYLGKQRMKFLLPCYSFHRHSKRYISTLPAFHEVRFIATQVLVSLQFWALSRYHFKQLGLGQGQSVQEIRILFSLGLYFLFHTLLPLFSQMDTFPPLSLNRSKTVAGSSFSLQ